MSRRKVRGLTRTGRQVSEDPDLDTLLSTLSPEEMEELEKDMMKVPDLKPEEGKVVVQGETMSNNVGRRNDSKARLSQREQSVEGDHRKESRKQEYLRKMGLSQEGNDDIKEGLPRQTSISSEKEINAEDRNNTDPEGSKEERSWRSNRYRKLEIKESDAKVEINEKMKCEDNKLRDRRENKESTGSKTKDMISRLQEKKEDGKDKERRDDCRRRDDNKTKDIISKLREKSEKELGKEKERKPESVKTQGRVSKMIEMQSKTPESLAQECKADEKVLPTERITPEGKLKRQGSEKALVQEEKRRDLEALLNHSDHRKEEKKAEETKEKEGSKEKSKRNGENEKVGNCVAKNSPNSKAKEDDEEDEDSSMFDELMQQVRSNDPAITELNVNNSEVIKTKTLIEFAEALRSNTQVKIFAIANCRADDHVAYAIAGMLRVNKTITSINVDSNHLTGKGILAMIQALPHNSTLTELRFQNQRHICGGKTEMEMAKVLKENTTLLKLGYHFELAGPRMTTTNILSRNMDRQRQRRLQEQKQLQANGEKKDTLDVPKTGSVGGSRRSSPMASPKPSPIPSPMPSPKLTPRKVAVGSTPPPPPPPPGGALPPPPPLTPNANRSSSGKNSRDQLLASIRGSNVKQLKKVPVPKWLQ
ncbi:leiomodin-1-like [Gouania willdenowi]|uniref:Leiomodin-1 n=1 Tax=Gouania willdenowi TaxID=441366 RepID=A0A8C5I3I2_GOUWI|nr:leiomodin-1 [Gouania willdenowi]